MLDQEDEESKEVYYAKVAKTAGVDNDTPDKKRRARNQHVLEDFGFCPKMMQKGDQGLGAASFANSLDHSDLRLRMKEAMKNWDEIALNEAIDDARDLGREYPYQSELEMAEAFFQDMIGIDE